MEILYPIMAKGEEERTVKENHAKMQKRTLFIFAILFLGLYAFFRYVHPVVPWDGDDWGTLGSKLVNAKTPYPVLGHFESERMFCSLSGTFFGYLAAFVVYPILGDYVLSIVTVNALALALTISLSLMGVYLFIKCVTRGSMFYAALGTGIFLLMAFVMLKTREGSAYLYWQYNLCTIYFYSIPSYLAGTFGVYLIANEVYTEEKRWQLNGKTAVLVGIWYLLNFSFLPAALLLAAISVMALLLRYAEQRKLKRLLKEGWFYWIILIGSAFKVFFEFAKTFGTGYLKAEGNLQENMKASLQCILQIGKEIHPLFALSAGIIVLMDVWVRRKKKNEDSDKQMTKVFAILMGAFVMLLAFFFLFGTISTIHIYRTIPRLDTLYVLFFLLLLVVTLSGICILNYSHKTIISMPILIIFMLFVVISPQNSFSDSYYRDSTPAQRYEIMQKVVKEAERRDNIGDEGFVVHMPHIGHYGGGLSNALYYHNITSRYLKIEFQYEDQTDIAFTDITQ